MKILVAEDEKMIQSAVKNFCKGMGVEIDCADNGAEAVELCKKETPYDFILMDMFMPELNGNQATEQIRKLTHGTSYVIFLMTGLEEMDEESSKKQGFDGLIRKPLKKNVFEDLVNKYKK